MRRRIPGFFAVALLTALTLSAHVGSPDVYFEGVAGPYRLYVTVRVPQVIPGIAEIEIRSATNDVEKIEIVPMRLSGAGSNLPPTPDVAERLKQDSQFFIGSLWLMESGALKVRVTAEGSKGTGELAVPVPAFARTNLPLQKPLGGLLFILMLFLAVGLVFIAGAASREGNLEPGEVATPGRNRRAKIVMAATSVFVFGILFLGNAWWGAEARNYSSEINYFKPPHARTILEIGNLLAIQEVGGNPEWSRRVKMRELIPDHNHLMHLFLISTPGMDRMWHLHPAQADEQFLDKLPSMPAGEYRVFADIVDKTGFPWTLEGGVDLPDIHGVPLTGDDSSWIGTALSAGSNDSTVARLPDGDSLIWEKPTAPIVANTALELKFKIMDKDGKPATDVEPYMGMAGHVEIISSDFGVFAHIHPAGSVSMAALELANPGRPMVGMSGDMPNGMAMPMSSGPLDPQVSFPYGFPKTGEYRVFVQIKRGGNIETGAFDVRVQ